MWPFDTGDCKGDCIYSENFFDASEICMYTFELLNCSLFRMNICWVKL
jgi:hypothetical protein